MVPCLLPPGAPVNQAFVLLGAATPPWLGQARQLAAIERSRAAERLRGDQQLPEALVTYDRLMRLASKGPCARRDHLGGECPASRGIPVARRW